jgi:hypothetical protein
MVPGGRPRSYQVPRHSGREELARIAAADIRARLFCVTLSRVWGRGPVSFAAFDVRLQSLTRSEPCHHGPEHLRMFALPARVTARAPARHPPARRDASSVQSARVWEARRRVHRRPRPVTQQIKQSPPRRVCKRLQDRCERVIHSRLNNNIMARQVKRFSDRCSPVRIPPAVSPELRVGCACI